MLHSGADQEDSSVIDELWATVTLSKNSYNTNTAPTGCGSNSNNHEVSIFFHPWCKLGYYICVDFNQALKKNLNSGHESLERLD